MEFLKLNSTSVLSVFESNVNHDDEMLSCTSSPEEVKQALNSRASVSSDCQAIIGYGFLGLGACLLGVLYLPLAIPGGFIGGILGLCLGRTEEVDRTKFDEEMKTNKPRFACVVGGKSADLLKGVIYGSVGFFVLACLSFEKTQH